MREHGPSKFDRRSFLRKAAAAGVVSAAPDLFKRELAAFGEAKTPEARRVAEVFFDLQGIHKWDNSNGDTWDPFWADDDNLYAFNCDGRGFGSESKNLAFNRLAGVHPSTLVGTQVNRMDEYGKGSQKEDDNATWKACGQECIDGVFYAFVSRNTYGSDSKDPLLRQLAQNASLIKSTDRGLTWTHSAAENYKHPMWPGSSFGAPFFVHYGKNGGQVAQDGAQDYVYAVSTNGFWNDGDSLVLGRVHRARLPELDAGHWEYYTGGNGEAAGSWSGTIGKAHPVLSRPAKCGQTPITFVPALGIYLLISWYNTETMTKWFEPNEMRYDFYQAPHPWGPWSFICSQSDRFMAPKNHMYSPSLCARFQEKQGEDVKISLFTAGCPFQDVPISPYKIWHIPVLLRTKHLPRATTIAPSDPQIRYKGEWVASTAPEDASRKAQEVKKEGGSAELSFHGTGIEYIAQKRKGQGNVDIYLDGVRQEEANLSVEDFPAFFGVVVFGRVGMSHGKHVIQIVSRSAEPANLEGFRVYA